MTTRLLVDDGVADDDLRRWADGLGWTYVRTVYPTDVEPRETIWSVGPGRSAHLVEDRLLGLRYLQLQGAFDGDVVAHLRADLGSPSVELAVLEALGAGTADERVRAARRLAVVADAPHPGALVAFEQLVQDDDADVRAAAVFATTYVGWRELEPLLRRVAAEDPDEAVRDLAARTLDALARHYW